MFCPRCATLNELEPAYCRQCGQELSSIRLVLEGDRDKSLQKLEASRERLKGGSAALLSFTLIGLAIACLGLLLNEPTLIIIACINLSLGSLIGLPLIYLGRAKLKGAARLLSKPQTDTSQSFLNQTKQQVDVLTSRLNAESPRLVPKGSVTEHTTLDLREPENVNRNLK